MFVEEVGWRCSVNKALLKILQNVQPFFLVIQMKFNYMTEIQQRVSVMKLS